MRITRDVEYALLTLVELSAQKRALSARQLAERLQIPFALLCKILQRLARYGLLESVQGVSGGYALKGSPQDITVAKVVEAVHGPINLVPCRRNEKPCSQVGSCTIRRPMEVLQEAWQNFLGTLSLSKVIELGGSQPKTQPQLSQPSATYRNSEVSK